MSVNSRKLLVGLAGLALMGSSALATSPPVFTGDVTADFVGDEVMIATDPMGDVGLPPNCPGVTSSGWDIAGVRLFYDRSSDTLYVGVDSFGILGDVDGDGDPGTTDPCVAGNFGVDSPDFGNLEAVVVGFDLDRDGDRDFVAGIDAANTTAGFGVSRVLNPGDPLPFGVSAGDPRPGLTVIAPTNTSALSPDIEFAIGPVSSMYAEIGAPFDNDADPSALVFNIEVFCGGFADDGIGEDFMTPTVIGNICVGWDKDPDGNDINGIPGTQITTQYSSVGVEVTFAQSDTLNPGAFAYDPCQDARTLDQKPTSPDFVSTPNILWTRSAPGATDSDSGIVDFSFVSLFDGAPTTASYAALMTVDVEDSGTPGRGNSMVIFSHSNTAPSIVAVPDSGENGLFVAEDAVLCSDDGIAAVRADLGDGDDSGAVDVFCYNLCPETLPIAGFAGTGSSALPGDTMEVPAEIEKAGAAVGQPLNVLWRIFYIDSNGDRVTIKGPRHRRLGPAIVKVQRTVSFRIPADMPQELLDTNVTFGVEFRIGTDPGQFFSAPLSNIAHYYGFVQSGS